MPTNTEANTAQSEGNSHPSVGSPERFYQRFGPDGEVFSRHWPRLTTEESATIFARRNSGLDVLLINPPIREWSFPNIMPIGQGYMAAVASMDGHCVRVLDLNAMRREPVRVSETEFARWIERLLHQCFDQGRPHVIGIGGIITQYGRLRAIARVCKQVYPEVPIVIGGGVASSMPEFMVRHLPIDVAVREEGEATFSEVLHCLAVRGRSTDSQIDG